MAYSSGHKMGAIVSHSIKCENCTHKKAILYSSGILYCWHCKHLKGK